MFELNTTVGINQSFHLYINAIINVFMMAINQHAKPNAPWKSCLYIVHNAANMPLVTKHRKFIQKMAW